jgi:hypothetical protein
VDLEHPAGQGPHQSIEAGEGESDYQNEEEGVDVAA